MNNLGDLSLLNYVHIWSQIPSSLVATDPFDAAQLTPALQEGFRSGTIRLADLPLTAAQSYVTRAKSCEQTLLKSLGLSSEHVTAFADQRQDFGDHFQATRYPWQDNERAGGVAIAEMTGLHEAVSKALSDVRG